MKLIFHTAQCGSSLLTALVGTVNHHTYSEPSWSHSLISNNVFPDVFEEKEGYIVKLPSGLCCTAVCTSSPKVFLFQKLQDHIYRHLLKGEEWPDVNYFFEYETQHCHPELANVSPRSDIEKIIFFWLNDVLWITESSNVLWIHSNNLFSDPKKTLSKVCDFFELPEVTNFKMTRYDVKLAGLKGSDSPLKIIDIPAHQLHKRDIKNSVILRPFRDVCPEVKALIKWVEKTVNERTLQKLSHLIYD